MLTSQDPGVRGYEGLHAEAGAGNGPAGSRLTLRPWPMPRPPGPGLRAEHGSRGTALTPALLRHRSCYGTGAGGGRPLAVGGAAEHEAPAVATALATPSAAFYNLTTGRGPMRAGAGLGPAFQPRRAPLPRGSVSGALLRWNPSFARMSRQAAEAWRSNHCKRCAWLFLLHPVTAPLPLSRGDWYRPAARRKLAGGNRARAGGKPRACDPDVVF